MCFGTQLHHRVPLTDECSPSLRPCSRAFADEVPAIGPDPSRPLPLAFQYLSGCMSVASRQYVGITAAAWFPKQVTFASKCDRRALDFLQALRTISKFLGKCTCRNSWSALLADASPHGRQEVAQGRHSRQTRVSNAAQEQHGVRDDSSNRPLKRTALGGHESLRHTCY